MSEGQEKMMGGEIKKPERKMVLEIGPGRVPYLINDGIGSDNYIKQVEKLGDEDIYVGLDPNPSDLNKACEKLQKINIKHNAHLIEGGGQEIDFLENDSVDEVVIQDVFSDLKFGYYEYRERGPIHKEALNILSEVARVLKKGGKLRIGAVRTPDIMWDLFFSIYCDTEETITGSTSIGGITKELLERNGYSFVIIKDDVEIHEYKVEGRPHQTIINKIDIILEKQ